MKQQYAVRPRPEGEPAAWSPPPGMGPRLSPRGRQFLVRGVLALMPMLVLVPCASYWLRSAFPDSPIPGFVASSGFPFLLLALLPVLVLTARRL